MCSNLLLKLCISSRYSHILFFFKKITQNVLQSISKNSLNNFVEGFLKTNYWRLLEELLNLLKYSPLEDHKQHSCFGFW